MSDPNAQITRLVERWSNGEEDALAELVEVVYDDLKGIARRHLRMGGRDDVLNTTGLVHEAYLRLGRGARGSWPSRAHFFAFCSKAMRRLLIDHARERRAGKRGGTRIQVPLSDDVAAVESDILDLLSVEQSLVRLEARSGRMARIVECRFYGGMSVAETAEALDTSPRTVEREWTRARAYLLAEILDGGPPAS